MNILRKALLLGAVAGVSCWATPITILNPSFESPGQAPNGFTFDAGDFWNVTGYGGVWAPNVGANNGSNFFASVPGGSQVLFEGFQSSADAFQDLGVGLVANSTYTLTYFVGKRYDVAFSPYTVALKAGATAGTAVTQASDSGGAPTSGNFVQRTITFTTGAVVASGDIFIDISSTGNGTQADFDLITLDRVAAGTVPEPGALSLMGLGIAALAYFNRRRRTV